MSYATNWGTTANERALAFPCDQVIDGAEAAYYRGISVGAGAPIVFRWLCQLRVGSYSYGRRSPEALTPALDKLASGQRFLGVFELADFEWPRHLTLRLTFNTWGSRLYALFLRELLVCYLVVPQSSDGCRLLAKYAMRFRRGPLGWLGRVVMPWADVPMARKQFLNLKRLAERSAGALA